MTKYNRWCKVHSVDSKLVCCAGCRGSNIGTDMESDERGVEEGFRTGTTKTQRRGTLYL